MLAAKVQSDDMVALRMEEQSRKDPLSGFNGEFHFNVFEISLDQR